MPAAMAHWPAESYLLAMTTDDLHEIARHILTKIARDHPDVASEIAALVLTELLGACLFGDDEAGITAFADAINRKLNEISLAVDAPSS
jgi:hypothetical protein